mmetsp:Transcript_22683/g.27947  ORF Transcript_22683/g.27947 Transcript_22683/m.27947 type:complete len:356 (+) Transcript_22683:524-1591(+)
MQKRNQKKNTTNIYFLIMSTEVELKTQVSNNDTNTTSIPMDTGISNDNFPENWLIESVSQTETKITINNISLERVLEETCYLRGLSIIIGFIVFAGSLVTIIYLFSIGAKTNVDNWISLFAGVVIGLLGMGIGVLTHFKYKWYSKVNSIVVDNNKHCSITIYKDKDELIISGFGFDAPYVHGINNDGLPTYHITNWALLFDDIKDSNKEMGCCTKCCSCYCCQRESNQKKSLKYYDQLAWSLAGKIESNETETFVQFCDDTYDSCFGAANEVHNSNFSINDFFKGILTYKERVILFNFMVNYGRPSLYAMTMDLFRSGNVSNTKYHNKKFDIESVKLPKKSCCYYYCCISDGSLI